MTDTYPISGADTGLPTLTRRGLLAAAPALALLPASAALPAQAPSVKEQIEGHIAALMVLLRGCALPDFPKVENACIIAGNGSLTVVSNAFGRGEFKSGDQYAVFLANERWEVQ